MNKTHLTNESKIVVIGAGIGGLVIALALHKQGVKTRIYESARRDEKFGAGIILSVNAMKVLSTLDVAEKVVEQGRVVNEISLIDPKGKILSRNRLDDSGSLPAVAIHRKKLHQILSNSLPNDIQFSKKCIAVDTGKSNCFFKDESVEFDLLIGSDGINSIVRSEIGIDQPIRDANQICYRGTLSLDSGTYDKQKFFEAWGNGKRFGFVNIGINQIYWYATLRKDCFGKINPNQVKEVLLKEFSEWSQPIPEIISSQNETEILRNDLYDRMPVKNWSVGNIVLLGDAIHSTTPNLGQGAAMAIESGAVLAKYLMSGNELSESLQLYQQHRIERTRKVTEMSRMIGRMGNTQGRFICGFRNSFMGLMPDWISNRSANELFYADVLN